MEPKDENYELDFSRIRRRERRSRRGLWVLILLAVVILGACGLTIWKLQQVLDSLPIQQTEAPTDPLIADPLREAQKKIEAYALRKGIDPSRYPATLVELLARNPETEAFVLDYPFHMNKEVSLTSYDRSNGVPLFLQWDAQWGYRTYGSDLLAITGCGPTCLAMVGFYLTGEEKFSPDQVAKFAESNGYYSPGHGTSWDLISAGGEKLGLNVTEIPLAENRRAMNLKVDNPIICVVGPGDFTTTGHYLVLRDYQEGKFYVNDPNSVLNSQQAWTYDQLAPQIRAMWVLRK